MGRVDRGDVRGESRNHHVHSLVSIYGLVVILLVVGVWGGGGSWPVMGEKEEVPLSSLSLPMYDYCGTVKIVRLQLGADISDPRRPPRGRNILV